MFDNKKTEEHSVDVNLILANERTLLAWVRTGITLIAGGVAVAFLAGKPFYSALVGVAAIIFGGLISLIGYWRYHEADRAIRDKKLPSIGANGLLLVVGTVVVFAIILVVARSLS